MPQTTISPRNEYIKRTLEGNPTIDEQLVRDFEAFETLMRDAGIRTEPQFKVEPPLGGSVYGLRLTNE